MSHIHLCVCACAHESHYKYTYVSECHKLENVCHKYTYPYVIFSNSQMGVTYTLNPHHLKIDVKFTA
jgi:hypothetical protein